MDSVRAQNMTIGNEFNLNNREFAGYHVNMDKAGVDYLMSLGEVKYVEEDGVVRVAQANCVNQENAVWGLARTSAQNTGSRTYTYNSAGNGNGVTVYVIDTGVLATHTDFGGRATAPNEANFIPGESADDLNGHGTHCAGTIAGNTYGMAKQAAIVGVKVLGRSGSGTTAGVISGVNYSGQGSGAVLSMSLGGGASTAMDDAVNAAANAGNHVVVASGNSNTDACNSSPARAGGVNTDGSSRKVITVNSQTDQDVRSSFSNYGRCTDLFAPGSSVTSAWIGSNTATNTISGTSMACPHVAGMMAKYISSPVGRGADPDVAKAWLFSSAVQDGLITNPGNTATPNRLLTAGCGAFDPQ